MGARDIPTIEGAGGHEAEGVTGRTYKIWHNCQATDYSAAACSAACRRHCSANLVVHCA